MADKTGTGMVHAWVARGKLLAAVQRSSCQRALRQRLVQVVSVNLPVGSCTHEQDRQPNVGRLD